MKSALAEHPWWPRVWATTRTTAKLATSHGATPLRADEPSRLPPLRADEVSRHRVRLVALDRASGSVTVGPFAALPSRLRAGDLVVVNDAATLPASLRGRTRDGAELELRLSAPLDGDRLVGVLFGTGDWRTRTEHRPPPPRVAIGDRIDLGAFGATVASASGRRVELVADVGGDLLCAAIYASALPVQYAHRSEQLPLYAVQTAYAARPWAVEMPSAGRPLTWSVILDLRRAGVELATLTHAAGLGSTGDDALDRALPWPERYAIPSRTADAVARTKARGGRVIAIGTSVVRALEASRAAAGEGVATLRIDRGTALGVVDGLVSGLHVPGESHFELLEAFARRGALDRLVAAASAARLSAHELGDACLIV